MINKQACFSQARYKKIIIGTLTLILLVTGFFIWQSFLCPGCLASEQKIDSLKEEQTLGEQELDQRLDTVPQVGSPAPYFVLEDLRGNKVSLSDFAGKNVLLVFWATYCGWCEKERPDLNRFTEEQKGKIEVLTTSKEPKEILKRYVKEKEINFTVLFDPGGKTQIKYLALGTPNHFLINKQGKIVATRPGYASYGDLLMLTESLEE